jgi:predicted ester cyclase
VVEELTEEFVRSVILKMQDGFNDRNDRAIEEVLDDHFIDHSHMLGRMDIRQRIARVQEAFPDARFEVKDFLIQGPAVAWTWTIRGTHAKEILGVEPTGKQVSLPGMSMALFQHGKAIEHWEFADIPQLLAQLHGTD